MKTNSSVHPVDSEIFAAARTALDRNLAVPASVRVHVDAGTVTLTGSVRNVAESAEAEATVRRVNGVRRVLNEIFVLNVPVSGFEPPDAAER